MDRRATDQCARADGAAAAWGRLTHEPSAVRVRGDGGGRRHVPHAIRPGSRVRAASRVERCLAQRRELECRSHGIAHQLAERALGRATCRQRGEHVFVKVERGSDGMGRRDPTAKLEFGSNARKIRTHSATRLARPSSGSPRPDPPLPAQSPSSRAPARAASTTAAGRADRLGAWIHESAGISRHGEGEEGSLHRRSSDPRWPRAVRRPSARAAAKRR